MAALSDGETIVGWTSCHTFTSAAAVHRSCEVIHPNDPLKSLREKYKHLRCHATFLALNHASWPPPKNFSL